MSNIAAINLTREQVITILDSLDNMYPEAECELAFSTIYQLLVSVVLSAQTTDKRVNMVTPTLFAEYPDAVSMALAAKKDLEGTIFRVSEIIKSIGMYKTKSANVVKLSIALADRYNGEVPADYDKLVELPGVGRKTANVVLAVGFGQQRIAVDTHVFRVSNRIGLVEEKDVLKTELSLMEILPSDRLAKAHHSLIFHGRYCCHARKPDCNACPITYLCRFYAANQNKTK